MSCSTLTESPLKGRYKCFWGVKRKNLANWADAAKFKVQPACHLDVNARFLTETNEILLPQTKMVVGLKTRNDLEDEESLWFVT